MDTSNDRREKLIQLLQCHYGLARRVQECLISTSQNGNENVLINEATTNTMQILSAKEKRLNTLSLRAPIIAPLKTGKSTIINALIGDEVLPTRNEAMTCLPTEVRLTSRKIQTRLLLTDTFLEVMQMFHESVTAKISGKSDDELRGILEDDRFVLIAHHVHNFDFHRLQRESYDVPLINEGLRFINDLIRLTLKLGQRENFWASNCPIAAEDFPVIEASYTPRTYNLIGDEYGECLLNLVDTPGSNESGGLQCDLHKLVKSELRKGDVVLVALDYTKIGSSEDARIESDIAQVRSCREGEKDDGLYALVNKVDQRRRGERTEEEVKQHIQTKYNINEAQVFELKAVHGLQAKKYMTQYEPPSRDLVPSQSIADVPTAQDLLREIYLSEDDLQQNLEQMTAQQVYEKSKRVYEGSGLERFLQHVFKAAGRNVLHLCMQSCIYECTEANNDLTQVIGEGERLLGASLETLKQEIQIFTDNLALFDEAIKGQRAESLEITHAICTKIAQVEEKMTEWRKAELRQLLGDDSELWKRPKTWSSKVRESPFTKGALIGGLVVGAGVIGVVATAIVTPVILGAASAALTAAGAASAAAGAAGAAAGAAGAAAGAAGAAAGAATAAAGAATAAAGAATAAAGAAVTAGAVGAGAGATVAAGAATAAAGAATAAAGATVAAGAATAAAGAATAAAGATVAAGAATAAVGAATAAAGAATAAVGAATAAAGAATAAVGAAGAAAGAATVAAGAAGAAAGAAGAAAGVAGAVVGAAGAAVGATGTAVGAGMMGAGVSMGYSAIAAGTTATVISNSVATGVTAVTAGTSVKIEEERALKGVLLFTSENEAQKFIDQVETAAENISRLFFEFTCRDIDDVIKDSVKALKGMIDKTLALQVFKISYMPDRESCDIGNLNFNRPNFRYDSITVRPIPVEKTNRFLWRLGFAPVHNTTEWHIGPKHRVDQKSVHEKVELIIQERHTNVFAQVKRYVEFEMQSSFNEFERNVRMRLQNDRKHLENVKEMNENRVNELFAARKELGELRLALKRALDQVNEFRLASVT